MTPALVSLFTATKLTSGRRMYAFEQMRTVADAAGEADIVTHIDKAIAHETHVQGLNRRWKAEKGSRKYAIPLADINHLTDGTLSAFRDMLGAYIKGAAPDDVNRAVAERLVDELFPGGVFAITSLPYVEKLSEVELLLGKLQGELSPGVLTLRLDHMVDRLVSVATSYRERLNQAKPLRFPDVRRARERGHNFMLEVMSIALGRYFDTENADHVNGRAALLEPIIQQDLAMRRHLRARRGRGNPAREHAEARVDDVPVEQPPVDALSIDDAPVEQTPVDDVPVDALSVDDVPVEQASAEHMKKRPKPGASASITAHRSVCVDWPGSSPCRHRRGCGRDHPLPRRRRPSDARRPGPRWSASDR